METIGDLIKQKRTKKRYSRKRLESVTRIKKEFIEAIEHEQWGDLPEFPVIAGFVKTIAKVLLIDEKRAAALLRRDYPPKKLRVNPKPDISEGFRWSPKLTFIVSVALVLVVVLGYLTNQYLAFTSPPNLRIFQPIEGEIVVERNLKVIGETDTDAVVRVNNQPTIVDQDGKFETELEISDASTEVEIVAISRAGKETIVVVNINPKLEK